MEKLLPVSKLKFREIDPPSFYHTGMRQSRLGSRILFNISFRSIVYRRLYTPNIHDALSNASP